MTPAPAPGSALNPWLESRLAAVPGALVVDVGSGNGFWTARLAAIGMWAVGVDRRAHTPGRRRGRTPFVAGDALALPLRDASVDVVWCVHVLHHLDDPAAALAEARRVLRPGGRLVLAETVEDNPAVRLARRVWGRWDGVPVLARFTAAALRDEIAAAGFAIDDERHYSLVSFAAWALPGWRRRAWQRISRLEERLPARFGRWGAHFECVARPADVPAGPGSAVRGAPRTPAASPR